MFPLHIEIKGVSGAPKTTWNVQIAEEKFMSATLVGDGRVGPSIEATVSERRDVTWTMKSRVTIRGHAPIELDDFGVAIGGMPETGEWVSSRVVRAVGDALNNPWENVHVDGITATLELKYERDVLASSRRRAARSHRRRGREGARRPPPAARSAAPR